MSKKGKEIFFKKEIISEILQEKKEEFETWIGFDLDNTLAKYEKKYMRQGKIGEPIKPMIEKLKQILEKGIKVKIFTARAHSPKNIPPIKKWLKDNHLPDLEVTNIKDPGMWVLFDDRVIQVEPGTGKIIGSDKMLEDI